MLIFQLVASSIWKGNSNERKTNSTLPAYPEQKQYIDGIEIVQLTLQRNKNSTSFFIGKEIVLFTFYRSILATSGIQNDGIMQFIETLIYIYLQQSPRLLMMNSSGYQMIMNERKENSTLAEKKQCFLKAYGKEIVLFCE